MQRPQTLQEILQSLKSFPKSFQEFIQQEDNTQRSAVPEESVCEKNPEEKKENALTEPDRKKRRLERNKKSACLHRERKNKYQKISLQKIQESIQFLEALSNTEFPNLGQIDDNATDCDLWQRYLTV